jgi:hypothetical protein
MKLLAVLAMILAGSVVADEIPAEAVALQSKLYSRLPNSVRIWINVEAAHLRANPEADDATVRAHAQKRFAGQRVTADDMDALVFLTMTLAAQQTDRDLQAESARAKAVSDAKHLQRPAEPQAPARAPSRSIYGQAMDRARAAGSPASQPAPSQSGGYEAMGSADDTSEATALRLQMMTECRSQFISTLSNVMKRISSTQDTLVQNLK